MTWFATMITDVIAGSIICVVMPEEVDRYLGRCTKRIKIVMIRMKLIGTVTFLLLDEANHSLDF